MKLSTYAKQQGISYKTAWRWFKLGHIPGKQMLSGTVLITEESISEKPEKYVVYARVSSPNKKEDLYRQANEVEQAIIASGKIVFGVVKEIASGMNDNRPKLRKLLEDDSVTHIVVRNKDRLTRFGFNYIETLLNRQNRNIIVLNRESEDEKDLFEDLVSVITSFCARLYGKRRGEQKVKTIRERLTHED
jgi:putative resolvase